MKSYFEPTGRLIMSIGKDLIKDLPAALVELVKNSYDADATFVKITYIKEDNILKIIIEDNGHGMSKEIVLGAWMIPSTAYKLEKKQSPKGRIYQGRKGIGRYATSLLGNKLELYTIKDGYKTVAFFDWNKFNTDSKLSEIPIDVNTYKVKEKNGTTLIVINEKNNVLSEEINEENVIKIERELSKLLSKKIDFKIEVCYKNFFSDNKKNICKEIIQLEFNDAYHYRLSGIVKDDFRYELLYQNFYTKEEKKFCGDFSERLPKSVSSCGEILIDYKVYDKDPSGIEVIMNFINGAENLKYGKNDIKEMLIEQSGISIFRNKFRIRPYGDKGFDWLNLDSKRIQNPSMAIGSEQINGRINIESEEKSGLKEKSARDGLYENSNFFTLQRVSNLVLNLLERERFKYRHQGNKKKKELTSTLNDFSSISENIEKVIKNAYEDFKESPENIKEHLNSLNKEVKKEIKNLEKEKEKEFTVVKETIAIYQKHTTLGNVISVVLHEGRKPLSWFTNKLPQIERKLQKLLKNNEINNEGYDYLLGNILELKMESLRMSNFFKRLDPLASNKRKKAQMVNIKSEIEAVIEIFETIIKDKRIFIGINYEEEVFCNIIEEDLYMALTNILENAIFWVQYSKYEVKKIDFKVYSNNKDVIIEIIDNGPGISEEDIKENLLFIPGYSHKNSVIEENGTGLGLPIAGEAIRRNGGTLEVIENTIGACFRIILKKVEGN